MSKIFLDIVERHADEAAFLFQRRDRAVRSPLFDLPSLAELDERLDANLEGLIVAGKDGLQACAGALDRARRNRREVTGEVFTATYVAAELPDMPALVKMLRMVEHDSEYSRAVVWALAWLSPARAADTLAALCDPGVSPALFGLAIGAHTLRRSDPAKDLDRAIASTDAALRAHAFRAAGELGRRDLLPALLAAAGEQADPWAAWSAALLGDAGAVRLLWGFAEHGGHGAVPASALAARCTPPAEAADRLLSLSRDEERLDAALDGAMALGDSACLSWVLPVLGRPQLARKAAWVYATVTGARMEPPLAVRKPTLNPESLTLARHLDDPFGDLPSPDPQAIADHWERAQAGFPPGERFLGGRRLDPDWLVECLRTGPQPWRASAAVELRLTGRDGALFPVRGHGRAQAARLPARSVQAP